jgi:hypothetical protein
MAVAIRASGLGMRTETPFAVVLSRCALAAAAAIFLTGCAQIIARTDATHAVQESVACVKTIRDSADGQIVYARLWRGDGSDTANKLTDLKPLTADERDALVRVHTKLLPCREYVIQHDDRFAAWETPYWTDLYQRSDEIYLKLVSDDIPVGVANRLYIESYDKFRSDVARGHAQAVSEAEIRQQQAANAMLQASATLLASQPRPQVTTTNCSWMGNNLNCVGVKQ